MVRVPGFSGDSGFHRESQEEVQVKTEQGKERDVVGCQIDDDVASARRNSVDGREADLDPDPDLEEKPHPPQVSGKGTPADPDSRQDSRQDPLTKQTKVKAEPCSFIDPDKPTLYLPKDTQVSGSEVGKPRSKTVRKKMTAPDDEEAEHHPGSGWSEEDLTSTYHRKELSNFVHQVPVMRTLKLKGIADLNELVRGPSTLTNRSDAAMERVRLSKEADMVPGLFDEDALFDLELNVSQATSRVLFEKLQILVGEVPQNPDPLFSTMTNVVDNLTRSSHYAPAAEHGSDTSSESPRRMSLGPSGASMLEARSKIRLRLEPVVAIMGRADGSSHGH
ncbi:LOW QUALITY PROTEIN: hypothetical protein PHMEG_00022657 [Phytophthora megakarya]|uniref:Uncharacterized protein n=1 Tax=Phytophthora megakarya TaxID=4795 RepID=A0A225VI70_9STRA|nr:LOW QUALITY PROTEIN: hypothetical protein PHMEG_00022657 [Phytophthora megakarya]